MSRSISFYKGYLHCEVLYIHKGVCVGFVFCVYQNMSCTVVI